MSHITRLQADNFKKLTAIDIRPGAGVVPIRGRNAQGKTSTLDAIQAALGGKRVMPSRPVRAGEDEGAIRLELDNGVVILRRFTSEGGDTLEVTNADGFKASSPQKMLDSLYASVAFDPLAFTRLEPKDQLARLRSLVKLDVDVDALDAANKGDYDRRRDKNRELSSESARLEQMPTYADAPRETIDEAALEGAIASAAEHNGTIERRRANREGFVAALDRNRGRLQDLKTELARLTTEIRDFEQTIADQEQTLANAEPLPDPIDVTQVQADLRAARATNEKITANAAAATQRTLVETLQREADELTDAMDQRRQQIADAIGRAEMPVPGLGFGDGEVLFNGLPLEQASAAEQLRVSTAIGMAQAPKLRVMLVRDGSLLDDEGEKILADLAEQNGFQLWVEAVDTSGKVGIVIEGGAVVAIDGEPAPEPETIPSAKRRARKDKAEEASEIIAGAVPNGEEIGHEPQKTAPEAGAPAVEEINSPAPRVAEPRRSILQHAAAGNSLFD